MPRRPLENLTESMFYVLLALKTRPMCGMEIAAFLERATNGRLRIGPATLFLNWKRYSTLRKLPSRAASAPTASPRAAWTRTTRNLAA